MPALHQSLLLALSVAAIEATAGTEEDLEGPIKPKASWWRVTRF